jgi:hypothetical protein
MDTNNNNKNTSSTVTGQKIVMGEVTHDNLIEVAKDEFNDKEEIMNIISGGETHKVERPNKIDSSYDIALYNDDLLANFLSRPIIIQKLVWTVGAGLTSTFYPWNDFITNPTVAMKINNFQLIRFNLNLIFQINATPFHYGRAIVSYDPYGDVYRGCEAMATPSAACEVMQISQLPHTFLDPTTGQTCELKLPFFFHKDWFRIGPTISSDFSDIGQIKIRSLVDLNVATSNPTSDVFITVYAYASEVKMTIPTSAVAQSGKGKKTVRSKKKTKVTFSDEYEGKGPVSVVAAAVANVASRLKDVPIIGSFARATEIGSSAIASIATLFGYSKPALLDDSVFIKNHIMSNLANVHAKDPIQKLTFDPKQETTLDLTTVGLTNGTDEMTIGHVVGRETFLINIPWKTTDVAYSEIFWINVTPGYCIRDAAVEGHLQPVQMSSLAFGAYPFRYWSGTIKFRFQVVASRYHRGRLRVSYEPYGVSSTTADYNTQYSEIIDLNEGNDFVFNVSWANDNPYLYVQHPPVYQFALPTGGIKNYSANTCNGMLQISVVNELNSPLDTADVSINVFASAGEDFEVFNTYDNNEYGISRVSTDPLPIAEMAVAEAQAGNYEFEDDENQNSAINIVNEVNLVGRPNVASHNDKALIFHGDPMVSFRALLKRYILCEMPQTDIKADHNSFTVYSLDRNTFPKMYGTPDAYTTGGTLNVRNTTLLTYLYCGYRAYKGGIRYKILPYSNQGRIINMVASRDVENAGLGYEYINQYPNSTYSGPDMQSIMETELNSAWHGAAVTDGFNQPVLEFELPYYNLFRFCVAHNSNYPPGLGLDGTNKQWWRLQGQCVFQEPAETGWNTNFGYMSYVSVGEDFNFIWYLGAPYLYFPTTL